MCLIFLQNAFFKHFKFYVFILIMLQNAFYKHFKFYLFESGERQQWHEYIRT